MVRQFPRVPIFLALLLFITALVIPLPYVIVEPGEPQNILGKAEKGSSKRLIEIAGVKTFPTTGKLNLTSIYVSSPESKLFGFDVLSAWFDGERSVQPKEVYFPKGVSSKAVDQQNSLDMRQSQEHAKVSALQYLGYKIPEKMIISDITKESPNIKTLKNGDEIIKLDGIRVTSATGFKKLLAAIAMAKTSSDQMQLTVLRDGVEKVFTVRTYKVDQDKKVLGLMVESKYQYPFTINISLKDVGGPSAGLMFSLGIVEKLRAENLTRGRNISGTGTIDAFGNVGPIGGIEEKLIGAARAGSKLFLAPALNCDDIQHIPSGLQVVAVETLREAVAALKNKDLESLPACG
jgi:PDZ domain-containing protein